ncbi:MAG: OmpA family protein [Pseudomonadota bacterium]
MLDAQRTKLNPGIGWTVAVLLLLAGAFPAMAQETVYIGGRSTGPAVEVDFSALNQGGIPTRRTRPGPPDILPLDPAYASAARATSSVRLTPPQAIAPVQPPAAATLPVTAPPPAAVAPTHLTPRPLSAGLTPAPAPAQPAAKANLSASAPPKPIIPAKAAVTNAVAPPPPVEAPKAVAALPPAGLSPSVPSAPSEGAAAALMFAPGAIELTAEAAAQLDALMTSLTQKERVQLKAHASGAQDDAEVRRIALKRALAARSHLLANGMESTRIDVRALGPAGDGGPDDRLDVIVVAQ